MEWPAGCEAEIGQQQQGQQHLTTPQSKSLGLFSLPTPSQVWCSRAREGGCCVQSVQLSQHQPQSMQGGLHPYLQGITCVVYTAPLLTLKPFLEGNFLVLCKNLNHTLKQAQGLTVLATLI